MEQPRKPKGSPNGTGGQYDTNPDGGGAAIPPLTPAVDGEATRRLRDRVDRLIEDAHGVDDAEDASHLTAELEHALDRLTDAIDEEDRDPTDEESSVIAEAERVLDELEEYEDEEDW